MPELCSAGLGIAFLSVPGAFLPLDLVYAVPGILTYATRAQFAAIYLAAFSLALLAGLVAWGLGVATSVAVPRAGARVGLALVALAVLHGFVVWLDSLYHFSPATQNAGTAGALAVSLALGAFFGARLAEASLRSLFVLLRAVFLIVAAAAVGAVLILALGAHRPPPAPATAAAAPGAPPIIFITVDTLSAMHLPMYGYARDTAPRLSEFTQGATLFLHHYANANFTTSAFASILYGTRPWTHRLIQHEGRTFGQAPESSLPAVLRRAGYYTAAVSTNPWASPRNFALEPYFAAQAGHRICAAADPRWALDPEFEVAVKSSFLWSSLAAAAARASDLLGICQGRHFDPELAFSAARRLLSAAPADRPIFLWVHVLAPHDPYITPPPFVDAFASTKQARDRASTTPPYLFAAYYRLDFPGVWLLRYDQAIRFVDDNIGAFLDELKKRNLYDRSLIVITADHGESLSKGYGGHGGPALHEELIRIPLLVKTPGQREARVVEALSEQVDVLPTLLDLAGIGDRTPREGVSLVPAMQGRAIDRPVFSMNFQQSTRLGTLDTGLVAMLQGQWKLVHYFGNIYYPGMYELRDGLYEVRRDPKETRNLIAAHPRLALAMLKRIEEELRRHGRRIE